MQNELHERWTLVADAVWKVHISFLWLSWGAEQQRGEGGQWERDRAEVQSTELLQPHQGPDPH